MAPAVKLRDSIYSRAMIILSGGWLEILIHVFREPILTEYFFGEIALSWHLLIVMVNYIS